MKKLGQLEFKLLYIPQYPSLIPDIYFGKWEDDFDTGTTFSVDFLWFFLCIKTYY